MRHFVMIATNATKCGAVDRLEMEFLHEFLGWSKLSLDIRNKFKASTEIELEIFM